MAVAAEDSLTLAAHRAYIRALAAFPVGAKPTALVRLRDACEAAILAGDEVDLAELGGLDVRILVEVGYGL